MEIACSQKSKFLTACSFFVGFVCAMVWVGQPVADQEVINMISYQPQLRSSAMPARIAMLESAAAAPKSGQMDKTQQQRQWITRREANLRAAGYAAMVLTLRGRPASAAELQTYTDSRYGVSFGVPAGWSEAAPQDRPPPGIQRLVVSTDPKDASNNIFVSFTALRPDVTGLGSFGSIDEFARTVIPQCNGAPCSFENGDPIDARMLRMETVKGSWAYDYTLEQKDAPRRHLRSLFSVKQEAGSTILVSLNAQSLDENYAGLAPTFVQVLESFQRAPS